jgi:hypothetical protein
MDVMARRSWDPDELVALALAAATFVAVLLLWRW